MRVFPGRSLRSITSLRWPSLVAPHLIWILRLCTPAAIAEPAVPPQPTHWAFEPIRASEPPKPKESSWIRNPIDAFILANLEANNLAPAGPASRAVLLRRVSLDLVGLPPTPEEIEAFTNDARPEAYAELIERLLASPHYGERWARHWLDVARYGDTGGFEKDLKFKNAWQFRDYVIRAFNANKPFDRFIQEQVAGDELWPEDPEAVVATGFFAVGPVSQDSALTGTQLEYEWLTDAVDTTGAAFLGLTLGCARCHDHKYDPITQKDYFALQAVFAASDRPYPPTVREHRIKGLNGILADVPIPKELLSDPRCKIKTDAETDLRLFHVEQPREIRRLQRGELSNPKESVPPGLPAMFGKTHALDAATVPAENRRSVLARWLVSESNPLTARVVVNRIWGWHFGQGLVRTPNDFGSQGELPTHPQLLDWLARDLVEHGWDVRRLHRLILTSATYQMQSIALSARAAQIDPNNRWLSHFPRRRLSAETIWDCLHACAGTLNPKQFGPPVVPPLTSDELSGLFGANEKWMPTKDPAESARRAIYLVERRTFIVPLLAAFDAPDVMASCAGRFETTVPAQALALLNSAIALKSARDFARRLLRDCGDRSGEIPARAWWIAFNRAITAAESERAAAFLRTRRSVPEGSSPSSDKVVATEEAVAELCLALINANEFVFVD